TTPGALPALPDMPTLAVAPTSAPSAARPRLVRSLGYAAAVVFVAVAGWAVTRMTGTAVQGSQEPSPETVAVTLPTAPPPASPPQAPRPALAPTGKLRILTSPPSAEIFVDDRPARIGAVAALRRA